VRLAAGRRIRPVWQNLVGGLTFEIGRGDFRIFIKWSSGTEAHRLVAEAARLRWAHPLLGTVPRLVEEGCDDDGTWLVTAALSGENAVSERWRSRPAAAVEAIGKGLRAFHDTFPVADCPFSWSADDRSAVARERVVGGLVDPQRLQVEHRNLNLEDALALIEQAPEIDHLVVCQGDACAPNTLIDDAGHCSGHVDLGSLGVADRWADIAIATWSTIWNYGPGWELPLLDAYGVGEDRERTRYYRLLYDLGP
jgi:aminoglycoside phosphotransferase